MKDFNVRLTAQIAELKQTLQHIGTSVVDQRHGLAQLTAQLKDSLGGSTGSSFNELPNILTTVLDDQSVGALLVGTDGRYLLSNPAAESIFGSVWLRNIDSLSSEFGVFLSDKQTRCEHRNLPWQRCARGLEIEEGLFLVRRAEVRSEMWVRTISMPLRDEQGSSKGAVAFLLDTTEQMQVEQQVKQLIFALEQQLASIEMAHLMLAQLTSKLLDFSGKIGIEENADMLIARENKAPIEKSARSRPVVLSGVSTGVLSGPEAERSKVVSPTEIAVPQLSEAVKSLSANEALKSGSEKATELEEATKVSNLAEIPESEFVPSAIAASLKAAPLELAENVELQDGVEAPEQESGKPPEAVPLAASELAENVELQDGVEAPEQESGKPPEAVPLAASELAEDTKPKPQNVIEALKQESGTPTEELLPRGLSNLLKNNSKDSADLMTKESKAEREITSESRSIEPPGEDIKKASQPAAARTRANSQNIIKPSSGSIGGLKRVIKNATLSDDVPINEKLLPLTKTVLIVDDTPVNQSLLRLQLRQLGLNIEVAFNGKEAIEAISSKDFDLVFMDMDMPVMDGPTATVEIRKAEEASKKHVPIIAMTSYDRDIDRSLCLDSGMDDYLVKGVTQKQLAKVVAKFLHEEDDDAQPDLKQIEANVSAVDLESLRKMLGSRELEEIFSLFSSSLSTFLECMQLAIDEKSADAVTQFAHCIKGPASIMELGSLTVHITAIMDAARDGDWVDVKRSYLVLRSNFAEILKIMKQLLNETSS